ncbi:PIG-L family deacetylase [Shewanella atlantica]|uniref:PIG-L family deacetylase n=2 Tax=Shewanella atlantica TaxID=271099 RepID=A0A3S0IFZ5_9GAMM|nr:PIG-L family deacetylase [Shewanella atlantica]
MGQMIRLTLILLILAMWVTGCHLENGAAQSGGTYSMESVEEVTDPLSVIAIFAHPDDETWISGTLAKLADHGVKVFPVYATSGDAGSDRSGLEASGSELALIREQEAIAASQILGLQSPMFLRFPDGKLNQYRQEVVKQLNAILEQKKPLAILTFAEGGITGNNDHRAISTLTTESFSLNLVYFAISNTRANQLSNTASEFGIDYLVEEPVENGAISLRVDVSGYADKRAKAMAEYSTQFPIEMINAFGKYVETVSIEELIIVKNNSVINALLCYLESEKC